MDSCGTGTYSSTGYVLLGLLNAYHANASTPWEWDQASVFPPELQREMQDTLFPKAGKCSDYDGIVDRGHVNRNHHDRNHHDRDHLSVHHYHNADDTAADEADDGLCASVSHE